MNSYMGGNAVQAKLEFDSGGWISVVGGGRGGGYIYFEKGTIVRFQTLTTIENEKEQIYNYDE